MPKIMVIAGEASGDMHAAKVIKEMKKINSSLEFFGMGGKRMRDEGVDLIYDPTQLSTIGFVEAIKHLKLMYQILDKIEKAIIREEPEVALLVDYSYFNMKVAKLAQKRNLPVVDYFAPSAWVWGGWRAKKMAKYNAKIASVFPMEEKVYRQAGAEVEFVGHPLLDMVEPELATAEFKSKFNLSKKMLIGILPGSRKQEIDSLLTPMLEAAERIQRKYPAAKFLIPLADTIAKKDIEDKVKEYAIDIKIIQNHSYEVMEASKLILVASGTATLEAACLNTPMVIAYKTSVVSYLLGKMLIKLSYVGLPNIIAEKEIVPELLQQEVTGDNLAQKALSILERDERIEEMKADFKEVIRRLGKSGATKKVANLVLITGGISKDGTS